MDYDALKSGRAEPFPQVEAVSRKSTDIVENRNDPTKDNRYFPSNLGMRELHARFSRGFGLLLGIPSSFKHISLTVAMAATTEQKRIFIASLRRSCRQLGFDIVHPFAAQRSVSFLFPWVAETQPEPTNQIPRPSNGP